MLVNVKVCAENNCTVFIAHQLLFMMPKTFAINNLNHIPIIEKNVMKLG